jgi:dephospho-CoA kinase
MQAGGRPIIGIVGGIASGKSLIADQFEREGAAVVSADKLAHEVLEFDEVKRAVRERWGDGVFAADGEVDRAAMAKIVFAPPPDGPRERETLERLIHPEVGRLVQKRLEALQQDGAVTPIVLDVPLLVESGWNRQCDRIVYVDAPREQRLSRARARGWSEQDFDGREAAQHTLEAKRNEADLVIDNSGSPDEARAGVTQFCRRLTEESRPE